MSTMVLANHTSWEITLDDGANIFFLSQRDHTITLEVVDGDTLAFANMTLTEAEHFASALLECVDHIRRSGGDQDA